MTHIFAGLILILFNTNISFWDVGVVGYVTNILGYLFILFGINKLSTTYRNLLKIRPYVIMMIAYSIIFLLINMTGNSPLTMGMSITALIGAAFIIGGMLMTFIIIAELVKELSSEHNHERLSMLVDIMILLFIFAGISAFLNFIPLFTLFIMGTLFLLEALFLVRFYYVFLVKNENYQPY